MKMLENSPQDHNFYSESPKGNFSQERHTIRQVELLGSYRTSAGPIPPAIFELAASMYEAYTTQRQNVLEGGCLEVALSAKKHLDGLTDAQKAEVSSSVFYSHEINHPLLVAGNHAVLVVRDRQSGTAVVAIDITFAATAQVGKEPDYQVQLIKDSDSSALQASLETAYGGKWQRVTTEEIYRLIEENNIE